MSQPNRLVEVAVTGPLRRTFTYHLPDGIEPPSPGQRVLVEFGRKRTLGFYLRDTREVPRVATKPVLKLLDPVSHFPRGLFELCIWMADYYFANPADCLAAALPPVLKTRRPASLVWGTDLPENTPPEIAPFWRSGKTIAPSQLDNLRRLNRGYPSQLVREGVIVERWSAAADTRKIVRAYRVGAAAAWVGFFARRKIKPEPFTGERTRAELKAEGWTDHYLRTALAHGVLEPVYATPDDDILRFVQPRPDVASLLPNEGQQAAINSIGDSLESGFQVSLLHGVTGSGKTLVYCHLAQQVLQASRTVLVLTPEIALSGTTLAYLRGFFGETVTVIHSAMTERERLESWRGIRQGKYRIVVGPRSALFAPLDDLGLIIVDEEHDASYKQSDPSPRFHGRDCAIMRGKLADLPVLLGSASPSVESYHHAREGRYRLVTLEERPQGAQLPLVTIIDMRRQKLQGDTPYLSYMLKKEIDTRLAADQQAILFLNRRGYSPQLKCGDCGHVPACPECEIKLTFHKTGGQLWCHYCGYQKFGYNTCDKCGSSRFFYPGAGTQKVEEHVARLFENGRVLRFDSDTASGRKNAHQLLRGFAQGDQNLLLGTQMVTKGLDLPGVTLVGVLSADLGIDLPDFRAGERTFSRLLQVAGRSGRGDIPGEVFIQTYYPESEVIQDAARQDYISFFTREIESRRQLSFPPFGRLVRLVLASSDRDKLEETTQSFAAELRQRAHTANLSLNIMGPAACPISLLRGKARRHMIIKIANPVPLVRMFSAWEAEKARCGLPARVRLTIDVDPDDMM